MNRLYHTLFVFLFLTAFAGGNILYSQEVIDSIAAVVDDEIILESEISYGISTLLLESGKKYPSEAEVMELRNQVLNAYIIQKVLLAKALEETLFVEDRIIEKELQRKMDVLIGQIGSEEELVKYFNKPMRLIKREMSDGVRDGLLIEQLKGSQISRVRLRRPEIVEFFEEHKDILPVQPEEVEVSHILLEVKPSEESKAEKMAVIGGLRDQLIAGADFDSLAKLNSEDFSAEDGGRLGFTTRGDLVQSYEEAAFLLKPGEVSEPIESPYGLHLIKQIERQGERISTQHILIKLAPSESDWEIARSSAQEYYQRINNGEAFAEIARKYSADEETSEKGGTLDKMSLKNLPDEFQIVIESLTPGEISPPFDTMFGIHILRLDKYIPEHHLSLAEDWKILELYALSNKREKVFNEWVETLKKDHYIWPSN